MPASLFKKTIIAITLSILLPTEANADTAELEARILKLEKAIQAMQAQREAQDKQLDLLTKELTAMDVQVTKSKIAKSEEKGTSKGTPVFAAFKDGVTLEDGTGNWKLAINGRLQADYRNFSPDESAADTFSVRRARLVGTLTFYKDYVARVEGEYSGGGTILTYGYIDINKFQVAKGLVNLNRCMA